MLDDEKKFRVVSRDFRGAILRIWGDYSESRAEQLAADLRKENWSLTYSVEPVETGVRGGVSG